LRVAKASSPALVVAAILATACTASQAQPAPFEFTGSVGLVHRKLLERTATGATLLTETGPMAQIRLMATRPLATGGALGGRLTFSGGDIDYDGQTQAGVPLTTTTRQSEGAADLLWRPHAPAPWGEAWLMLGWLANRRVIRTPAAGGLDETSASVMTGVQWRSPVVAAGPQWTARLEAEGQVSLWHQLHVDYLGLLDPSRLEGGRKRQLTLRLMAAPNASPWEWGLEWSRLSQGVSAVEPVYRGGVLYGTVRQPELSIRDLTVRVSRRF
jgi:hypothetical protein